MSFNIKLFKFNKKPNSTKQPDMASGTSIECELIENTSILSPSIRLKPKSTVVGVVTETVTNQPIVSFNNGVATNFNDIVCQINAVQTGSGDPSPSNVRPISGFSSVVLSRDQGTGTTPTTWTAALGQTVYGGSLDVTSGTLTVTHGSKLFSDLSWSKHSSYANTYYADVPDIKAGGITSIVKAICSAYNVVSRQNQTQQATNYSLSATNINNRIFVIDDSYQNLTAFETGTANYRVVYELATPITIQITPIDISQNEGANNLWCNTGNILSCTYYKYAEISGHIYDMNYCYIERFNRYYFIDNIIYELGTWRFNMTCDVLATYKTEIGSSTQYVVRAASEYDGRIIDSEYPVKAKSNVVERTASATIFGTNPTYYYIVGIIGGMDFVDAQTVGGAYNGSVVYFALTQNQLYQLIYSLMKSVDMYNIDPNEISYNLQKQLINPIQYIHSIKCVPVLPEESQSYVATGFYAGFNFMRIQEIPEPDDNNENENEGGDNNA